MDIEEAEKHFAELVSKVEIEGISIDLERDNRVVARLSPVDSAPKKPKTLGELAAFLQEKKFLGDDADQFLKELRSIRAGIPPETNPWD